jgi:hypothetical protein
LAREERFGTGAPAPTKTATKEKKKLVAAPWACHIVLAEKKVLRDQEEQEELTQGIAEGEIAPHRKSAESEARLKASCAAHRAAKIRRVAARQAQLRQADRGWPPGEHPLECQCGKCWDGAPLHARSYGGVVGAADPAPTVNPPEQQAVPRMGEPGNNAGPQDLDEEGASCFT